MLTKAKYFYFFVKTRFWTLLAKRKLKAYGSRLKVNYRCHFTRDTTVGVDCHFNGMTVVGKGSLTIGDHFHSGSDILVITQNHNYYKPDALPYDDNDIARPVQIGKNCWIGTRVIILPGTVIEDGVVAQAGAVLSGTIPKYAVVGGNPWKILKFRDIERYEELEMKGIYV